MKNSLVKFCAFILLFCFVLPNVGCKNELDLSVYVTELRYDVFSGENQTYTIKGGLGFNQKNQNVLTLRLVGKYDQNVSYNAQIEFNGEKYTQTFKYNPISSNLTVSFDIPEFNLKQFNVAIITGGESSEITLNSIVPQNTMDYKTALKYLHTNQPDLINSYFDQDGNFTASIIARVIVKNDHPYWYVGLKKDNLKALLVDGITGEILAVREVF